jgi:hypothetical protein
MSSKKQTAVEYFLMGIYDLKIIKLEYNDKINQLSDLYHDAVVMEFKQQKLIYEGLLQNVGTSIKQSDLPTFEEYYKETYGK